MASEATEGKTLYVGNLPHEATELLLIDLFKNLGPVLSCKVIRDGVNDPYCFIEYEDYTSALSARNAMDGRTLLGKNIKVNWANSSVIIPKMDTSKHFHIFVGDLTPEINTYKLKEAFKQFGEISDCRVVKDLQTSKPRGYGFVSYIYKEDAQNAINAMNGQWLGSRVIRTNWAARKPYASNTFPSYTSLHQENNGFNNSLSSSFSQKIPHSNEGNAHVNNSNQHQVYHQGNNNGGNNGNSYISNNNNNYNQHYGNNNPEYTLRNNRRSSNKRVLNYNEVYAQASSFNTTVYCGGVRSGLTEQLIRDTFQKYGEMVDVRVFPDKGFAFIKYATKDGACRAIVDVNHTEIAGHNVRCSWGKETHDALILQTAQTQHYAIHPSGSYNNGGGAPLSLFQAAPHPYNQAAQQYYALAAPQQATGGAPYLYAPAQGPAQGQGLGLGLNLQQAFLQQQPMAAPTLSLAGVNNGNNSNNNYGGALNQSSSSTGVDQALALQQHLQFQQQLALQQHHLQCLTLSGAGAGGSNALNSIMPGQPGVSQCELAYGSNPNHPEPPGPQNSGGVAPLGNNSEMSGSIFGRNGNGHPNPASVGTASLIPSYMASGLPLSLLGNQGISPVGLIGSPSLTALPNYAYGYGYSPYWYAATSPASPYAGAPGPGLTQYLQHQTTALALPAPVTPQGMGILPAGWSPLQTQNNPQINPMPPPPPPPPPSYSHNNPNTSSINGPNQLSYAPQ